jgi:CRP/FNR family transcriptional regulator, cyclic AMP receptor protein
MEGMMHTSLHDAFNALPVCAGLDAQALETLATAARTRTDPKDRVIFWEGDPGDAFDLLLAGAVKVFRLGADGRELILAWLQADDCFGEMALFDGRPRSASVMTTEASTMVILHTPELLTLVKTSGTLLSPCLTVLCNRLRETDEKVVDLARLEVEQRIAKALLRLGTTVGVPGEAGALVIAKRPTPQALADLVGASRETVTRVFNALAHRGEIARHGRTVVLRQAFLERLGHLLG